MISSSFFLTHILCSAVGYERKTLAFLRHGGNLSVFVHDDKDDALFFQRALTPPIFSNKHSTTPYPDHSEDIHHIRNTFFHNFNNAHRLHTRVVRQPRPCPALFVVRFVFRFRFGGERDLNLDGLRVLVHGLVDDLLDVLDERA